MAITFNISDANHVPNSQLAANTLNVEINNVLKFYKSTIEALSKYDSSYSATISDDITQESLNTIIEDLFKKINNFTFTKGISLVNGAIGHTNSITASTKGQSTSYSNAYDKTIYVPKISVDSYGHVTSLSDATIKVPYQNLTTEVLYSGALSIESNSFISVNLSSSVSQNDLLEFQFTVYGERSRFYNGLDYNFITSGSHINNESYLLPVEILVSNTDRAFLYLSGSTLYIKAEHMMTLGKIIKYKLSN